MAVRARELDPEGLRDLYPDVLRVARRIVGDEAAEDVAQETFLRLLAAERPARPRAWLAKVARNLAIDELRRRKRAAPVEAVPDAEDGAPDVAELLSVRRAMQDLPDSYRLVLWLKHVEGRSSADIARITGTTQSSVEMRLFRARRSLAESYSRLASALSVLLVPLRALRKHGVGAAGTGAKIAAAVVTAGAIAAAIGPASAPSRPAAVTAAKSVPRARTVGSAVAEISPPAPATTADHAAVPASSAVALPAVSIDQVIAKAATIVVGVVARSAWESHRTDYRLRTDEVWWGTSSTQTTFALAGHPFIGRGTSMVVFLGRGADSLALAAFVVGHDGELFEVNGRSVHTTLRQLEARVRNEKPARARRDDDHDNQASREIPFVSWGNSALALLTRP
jgi:RNA polymerase sigma-70 factor (ECF subfamily)